MRQQPHDVPTGPLGDTLPRNPGPQDPAIERFTASDGYDLQIHHWNAHRQDGGASPKGFVVALHGIQSHSGWYEYSSRRMSDAGYDVRFLDRRGSGLNTRDRGHSVHADRLVNDVVQYLSVVGHERDARCPGGARGAVGGQLGGKAGRSRRRTKT